MGTAAAPAISDSSAHSSRRNSTSRSFWASCRAADIVWASSRARRSRRRKRIPSPSRIPDVRGLGIGVTPIPSPQSPYNVAVSAADDKIDELYQQPLADFISARNALAKTLSGADAQRVKALPKPTVVAWAANQVYWQARAAYEALMKSGERVRKAQIAALQGKAADVRGANEEHRRAVSAAVSEAERLASSAGSKPSPDALTRTFEAMSLTPHPPDPPGRLTELLQPGTGFEALAGITPVGGGKGVHADHGPAKGAYSRNTDAKRDPDRDHDSGSVRLQPDRDSRSVRLQPDRDRETKRDRALREREAKRAAEQARREAEEARAAAAAARKRDAELRKADALVARAEATEKLARASWEHAHDALLDARRKRDEIKKSLAWKVALHSVRRRASLSGERNRRVLTSP